MITDDFQKVSTTFYSHKQEIKAAIVICPALGVERVFYQNFTLWLAEQGYWVVTFDYSGQNNYKNQKIQSQTGQDTIVKKC